MNAGIISTRYAKALFEYTEQEEASEEVLAEMKVLARNFRLEPRLRRILTNPVVDSGEKLKLVKTAAGGSVSPQTERFLELVVRNNREELLQSIALSYSERYRKARNISVASLETAIAVPDEILDRIRASIGRRTKGQVELSTQINPGIIGGFVFQMNFQQIDASVASELAKIKKHFKEENRRLI